jgi:large subunit ribosomal protein L29
MSKRREALGRVRDLPDDELGQAHTRAREELFRLKLGNYTNQVENTISVRLKRRELARILTVQRARELALETQAEAGAAASDQPAPARKAKAAAPSKKNQKKSKPAAAKTKAKAPSKTKSAGKGTKKSGKEG